MPLTESSRVFACAALASLVMLVGCGGGESVDPTINATVHGTVMSDGKPVKEAMINFEKMGFGAYGTKLADDGTYSTELAAGEFDVTVVPIPPPSDMSSGKMPVVPKREEIPQQYRASSTSPAKVTITEGDNTFDLDLKKK